MLHCGANNVTREQVIEVKTPAATESWFPVAHNTLISRVEETLVSLNMRVVEQAHALTKGGDRYFGLLRVANCQKTAEDYAYVLGLRNSHDKAFTASLAVGASVFVCDNLSFSGEITIARKHTTHIERDLPKLTCNAVGLLADKWSVMNDRIARYKEAMLADSVAHDFIIRAVDMSACTIQQIPAILKEWRTPRHPEFGVAKSAWRLFNAFTEVAKDSSLALLPQRTIRLHGLMDSQVGFAGASATERVTAGTEAGAAEVRVN
jgi:Domain of unknown function (DUF932)